MKKNKKYYISIIITSITLCSYAQTYNETTYNTTQLSGGSAITTGSYNSFYGKSSGNTNTSGSYNSFFGRSAGASNTTGVHNTFLGFYAGLSNVGGTDNNGNYNTFVGSNTGYNNTTGGNNSCMGFYSGYGLTTGSQNTCYGNYAGEKLKTSSGNLLLGVSAGGFLGDNTNDVGSNNTMIGNSAGGNNKSGDNNVLIGIQAGLQSLSSDNTIVGGYSGNNFGTANGNTYFGYKSGYYNKGGSNTYIGTYAGEGASNDSINGNVFIGYMAGVTESGSNKLYITNTNDQTPLIYGDFSKDSLVINGILNVTEALWVNDTMRFGKGNTTTIENALKKINLVNGISFNGQYKIEPNSLQKQFPTSIKQIEKNVYAFNYNSIIPILIEAIKEQENEIALLKSSNNELKNAISTQLIDKSSNSVNNSVKESQLYQNNPNPFNNQTTINYYLSEDINSAAIIIYNLNGLQLKKYELNLTGNRQLQINANEFPAGIYIYTLIANGQEICSKRMILTE